MTYKEMAFEVKPILERWNEGGKPRIHRYCFICDKCFDNGILFCEKHQRQRDIYRNGHIFADDDIWRFIIEHEDFKPTTFDCQECDRNFADQFDYLCPRCR